MCIVNIQLDNDDILCNGAQGIVVDISSQGLPIVKYKNGYQMTMTYHIWPSETIPGIGVSQVPLILAWALTIHKSQGSTLDVAEIDAGSGIFECGQTYVALSRVKSLEGLYLQSFDVKKVRINKKVQEFYEILKTEEMKRVEEEKEKDKQQKVKEEKEVKETECLPESYEDMSTSSVKTISIETTPNKHHDFSRFRMK
jgi:uncharacterized membrane protein YdbT with pleckstrin-like domain